MAGIYISYKRPSTTSCKGCCQTLTCLKRCDAMIVVWGETTKQSDFVPAEVGTARATSTIAVVPVIVGDAPIPPFLHGGRPLGDRRTAHDVQRVFGVPGAQE